MATIIREISFKNFYNYYGNYVAKYEFHEGLNIINADNGMGKSKLFNAILWILKNQIYDSDKRTIEDISKSPLKMVSEKAKILETSPCVGVKIIFDCQKCRYTIEKSISFTKKRANASTSNPNDWEIKPQRLDVSCKDLVSGSTNIVYDVEKQNEIIQNLLISPSMQSYALLQGEAIDDIVDLSNSNRLAATVETLTDISELKSIEQTCSYLAKQSDKDLTRKQEASTTNKAAFEELKNKKASKETDLERVRESISIYKKELALATESAAKLEAQVANTTKRIQYQEKCKEISSKLEEKKALHQTILSKINDQLFNRTYPWLLYRSDGFVEKFGELRDKYTQARIAKRLIESPHETIASLLPEGSPDDVSLDKMLIAHKCFVCGTDAPDGSAEYENIKKLRDRSRAQAHPTNQSDMHLFFDRIQTSIAPYSRVEDILGSIATERLSINNVNKEIDNLKQQLEDAKNELFNYGGDPKHLDGSSDANLLNEYNKARESISMNKDYIKSAENRITELQIEIATLSKQIAANSSSVIPAGYQQMKDILDDAMAIFENTKKRIYDEVIANLEKKSNEFYQELTKGNHVLGGHLKFNKTSYDSISIAVLNDAGNELSGASEGFQRMKKIAVVMAIIASNIGGGKFNYPFIADAPFSAFGRNFINNFFDVVPEVFQQSIIMIKELYDSVDPLHLTENGKAILEHMKSGDLQGTFYVNVIPNISDQSGLETQIECYNK